jgi:hypothetical protein
MNYKTQLIFALILVCGVKTFAQQDSSKQFINKGQWLVGGSLSFITYTDHKNPYVKISSHGGYFVGRRLAVGLDANYFQKNNSVNESGPPVSIDFKNIYSQFSGSIFTRLYISTRRFAPYAEFNFGGLWAHAQGYSDIKIHQEFYKAAFGFNYFLSHSIAFNTIVSYTYFPYLEAQEYYQYLSGNNNWIDINLGFQLYLSGNKNGTSNENDFSFPKKGSWMIGAATDKRDAAIIPLNSGRLNKLEAAYFLKANIALGLRIDAFEIARTSAFSVSQLVRYYPIQQRLAPFAELSFGIGHVNNDSFFYASPEQQGLALTYSMSVGINYFLTNFLALENKLSFGNGMSSADKKLLRFQAGLKFFLSRK